LVGHWSKQRDQGVLSGPPPKRGRPEADPREREAARLRKELAKVEGELAKARKVIEIQSKLSALLEGLAAESAEGGSELRR
jgi:transposase